MDAVRIGAGPLTIADVRTVADGARVEVAPAAYDRIDAGRALVARALEDGAAIYGLTTQVGHDRNRRLDDREVRGEQRFLVLSHAGGFGPPLPVEVVRAAMLVCAGGMARGGAGASRAAIEVLVALLNAGIHPIVPETSSVGAGDVGQMATIAQAAIGLGRVEHEGAVLPAAQALDGAGIAPLELSGRDGLALIAVNGVSVGHAALVVGRARSTTAAADLAAALSLEAIAGNPSVLAPAVGRAKPIAGQIAAADHLRDLLDGSDVWAPDPHRSVQDPLSFRVVPQVHGALREHVAAVATAVEVELGASTDNPLVAIDEQALISNGNFHPIALAIACDAARIALAHVGRLSERRMEHLWTALIDGMTGPPPGPLPGMSLRYPAAAATQELRQLAAPATLDVPPMERGTEDHATGAPLAVRQLERSLDVLDDVLAVEVLLARDTLRVARPDRTLGRGPAALVADVDEVVAAAPPAPDAVHAALRTRFPRDDASAGL